MCDDVCLIEHSTLPHSRDRSVYGMDVDDGNGGCWNERSVIMVWIG